jgi:hypothetical protein
MRQLSACAANNAEEAWLQVVMMSRKLKYVLPGSTAIVLVNQTGTFLLTMLEQEENRLYSGYEK